MVLKSSVMMPLGTVAPDFSLLDISGKTMSLNDFKDAKVLLIVFMCNHCPYVIHIRDKFVELANEYKEKGVAIVAINSNDPEKYSEDNYDNMIKIAKDYKYTFPYLFDETQEVAKAYHAVCTPDFFLFDKDRKLVYRGQMDGSRPDNSVKVTGEDLAMALETVIEGNSISEHQSPSMGCSIKWKTGNEPDY